MSKLVGCDEDSDCTNCRVSVKEKEEDTDIEFLMGLNEEYAYTRTHILALRELFSLDVVYNMAVNDESSQRVSINTLVEASALYINQQE
ncbi:unnamed protein product [Rhodiola kirilowii]